MTPSARIDALRPSIGRLSEVRVPTLALGLMVAVVTWFVSFNQPGGGLDRSWQGGLYMASHNGLPFGTDVVFTYGPLGFLITASDWYVGMGTVAFLWLALQHVALAVGLVWALRRSFGAPIATLIAFMILGLLLSLEVLFALAALAAFSILGRNPPRLGIPVVAVVGSLYAAMMMLVKLSIGPPVLVMLALALVGARAPGKWITTYLALFIAYLLGLWLLVGGGVADLVAYVSNGRELISGYSEAMVTTSTPAGVHAIALIVAVAILIGLCGGAAIARYSSGLARLAGVGIALVAGFSLFKEGMVRFDLPHIAAYFSTMAAFWAAIPWGGSWRPVALGGATLLIAGAAAVSLNGNFSRSLDLLDPITNTDRAIAQVDYAFKPDERRLAAAGTNLLMLAGYALDERMLSELRGHSVSIDPWEIAAAWAYDLDWDPLPVFQNYNVWTSELDELNAERLASRDGPERVLRHNPRRVGGEFPQRTIDGRYPGWDPPAQALATLCNFEPLRTTRRWQLLGRTFDRCGAPVKVGSVDSAYGESVDVPKPGPGEVIFVRIAGADVSGFESLRTLLYRAKLRFAEVNGERSYRLVPGTTGDGLLLRGSPRITGSGPFEQAPQARTLELNGPGGPLRYDFYSMSVEDTPVAADEVRRG